MEALLLHSAFFLIIAEPHLSELNDWGHIVTAGKGTSSIECASVSTTVIIGSPDQAGIG